jgi:hypothetical protein
MILAAIGCYCAYESLTAHRWRVGWAFVTAVYWLSSLTAAGLVVGACR